ncbi:MAG TPA: O-methyltransferase [Candidatus Dormibacteraeota bacterium]|nr:O-methyltransferase [Candidatus Dormibacteraeota bacterium]
MSITYDYIDDYLYRIAQPRDELLERMEEYADTNNVPIIGPLVGRFLYNLARSSKSKKVLEIGTAIGYSGIWLARAIAPLQGSLTTIDMNPQRVKLARQNLAEAGLDRSVNVIQGNAMDVLSTLREEYDMIFLDSDKDVYPDAFKMSVPLLRKGGLFVADNALWGGDVAKGGKSTDTQSMIKFNRTVSESKGMSTVILPLRDGVLVSLKE